MDPKVTVIMPVYNGELYIEGAVASLLAQSFQDWELIIVDDGSVDSTAQILETFTDQRIQMIRQKNSGEASARNVGLNNARGEYIAFLDVDDSYFPNALVDLASFLDTHPQYDVVFSDGQICDEHDHPLMTLTEVRPGIYTGNILDKVVLSSSVVTVPICTMTRRLKILEHSLQFDPNLVIGPDWDFWIQLAVHVDFGYLDKLTCKYRIHGLNITKKVDLKKRKKDQFFGRLKVMNSYWFSNLSLMTRQNFFLDLLTNILGGNVEAQTEVLSSEQVLQLPVYMRSHLWRMLGIDVLENDPDKDHAKYYFLESQRINPNDRKTRFIIHNLMLGRFFTLGLIKLWRLFLNFTRSSPAEHAQSIRLQKLFGLR